MSSINVFIQCNNSYTILTLNEFVNQEESLARASTLYPSLITDTASEFYTHHHDDPDNAYYTHAMVYSPGVVLFRDDDGDWRSPVEVDVLTSAAVNAGEVRRELERKERMRTEKLEMEYWKRKGEERRKENEKAMAERQRLREEAEKNQKAKEEIEKLKKEKGKLQKKMVNKKEADKGKAKDSGSEKDEPLDEQEKAIAEVENENEENEEWEEVEVEKPEEHQENAIDSPDSALGRGTDSQLKGAGENTEFKRTQIQDVQPQPEASPEINQEPTSSNTIAHPPSPPTQPSEAPDHLNYAVALKNTEIQIYHTMCDRISRILHLFQLHQTPHLILGSFGTGVFKNRIDLIATIFADLLIRPGGRFNGIFQTVVFAILGKETVRVFTQVFLRADKRAQRERTYKTSVFEDSFGSEGDGDVKEGDEERAMRMMRWRARRRSRNAFTYGIPDKAAGSGAASFVPARDNAAFHPLSLDGVQAIVPYPTSSAAADAASYAPSFNAARADGAAFAASSSSNAARARTIPYTTEDAKTILTKDDEQVDFVAEASANSPTTPKAMVVDDYKDIEMMSETKSLPTRSREAQNSKKKDGDIEMQ